MVFPSVPLYLDPPNWQQQQGGSGENPQLPPIVPPPPPIGDGGTGSVRPSSMADRARLAKLPQPESALKCPRCESINTKFCYFNNYSLSQPRHFCKTCRRYWTRGGALRNVPVGGGCRRNKRSKGSRSKSPITGEHQSCSTSNNTVVSSNACTSEIISHLPPPPQLPFFPPLHNLTDFGNAEIGLNFCGIQPSVASTGAGPLNLSARFADQWRLQQFPLLSGLEQPNGVYQFEGTAIEPLGYVGETTHQLGSKTLEVGVKQLPSVKMEENQGPNFLRNFSSTPANDQYWSGNTWTDLSGSTSSASHFL